MQALWKPCHILTTGNKVVGMKKKIKYNWSREHTLHHLGTYIPCLGMIFKIMVKDQSMNCKRCLSLPGNLKNEWNLVLL